MYVKIFITSGYGVDTIKMYLHINVLIKTGMVFINEFMVVLTLSRKILNRP